MKKILLVLLFASLFLSCERDDVNPVGEVPTTLPALLTQIPLTDIQDDLERVPNHVFLLTESILGTSEHAGYRLQGNLVDQSAMGGAVDEIVLGNLTVPVEANGSFHKGYSRLVNEEEYSTLREMISDGTQTLMFRSDGVVIDQIEMNVPMPLRATANQDGINPLVADYIDKTKDLVLTWPVDNDLLSTRSEDYLSAVGATVKYKPLSSNHSSNGNGGFPDEDFSIWDYAEYEDGQIVFTAEDLEDFPDGSIVTIYIGRIRYRINADGELVVSHTGSTTVTTGGTQSGPLVRIQEP